jgi:transcription elongation factor GreA
MDNKTPIYLTPEGETKLRDELDKLVTVRRPALAERLRMAIQQGDLSENADYIAAKEEQGFLEGRIQQIENMLRYAEIITKTESTDQVGLGSRVTVVEEGSKDEEAFFLVGPAEADPASGKISYQSPLGEALMGSRADDLVRVEAPVGEIVFRIIAIE